MFLFLQGMNPDLQVTIRGLRYLTLADMVERATGVERGLYLSRGLNPKRQRETFSSPSQGKKSGSSDRASRHCEGKELRFLTGDGTGRVYTLTQEEADASPAVVQ
ncbi:hypothetical protein Dimus_033576, partial [Dionaea muscipula]